jgi:peptide deformylase
LAVLTVRVLGDPVLRRKAGRVAKIGASIQRLIDDMIDTMHAAGGVGLAAPQVGRPLRVIVIEVPPPEADPPRVEEREVIVLINPQIVRRSGERQVTEGCLSVPGYWAEISRSEKVIAKGLSREGREVRIKGEDLLAQALEHEFDHINGVLYIDHLESLDQLMKIEPEREEESGLSEPARADL